MFKHSIENIGIRTYNLANTFNNIGVVYRIKGEYNKALDYFHKCFDIQTVKLGKNHPYLAYSYGNIALTFENIGDKNKALKYFKICLKIRSKTLGVNHPVTKATLEEINRIKNE